MFDVLINHYYGCLHTYNPYFSPLTLFGFTLLNSYGHSKSNLSFWSYLDLKKDAGRRIIKSITSAKFL